jgi:hypothetical protein
MRLARVLIAVIVTVPFVVVGATAATAASARNGVCEVGEFCLYWGAAQDESLADFTTSVAQYGTTQPGCYDFRSAGLGQSECVWFNAASVWNRSYGTVRVYQGSDYTGQYDEIPSGAVRPLIMSALANASHQFV